MFSPTTHMTIERVYDGGFTAGVDLSVYDLVKFVVRNEYVELSDSRYGDSVYQLMTQADFVIGYRTAPSAKHVFELFEVDTNMPIVGEIQNWCAENLKEWGGFSAEVIKNRIGMPRQFPVFEMNDDVDATAFKLRWM